MSGPMTREEMLAQTKIAVRMAKGIDAALSLPDKVDLKALAGAMRGLVKRLEATHVTLTLSSPCAICGSKEPIAQFDDEMVWDEGNQCYVIEISIPLYEELRAWYRHHQGDHLPVRVIILEGKP